MQAANTQTVREGSSSRLATAVTILGIVLALVLFGVVVSRMGLLNGLVGRETAVSTDSGIVHITTKDMQFGQTHIRVQAGQPVTLQLDNYDLYGHSFDVDELNLHVQLPPNGRAEATFTATAPGTYQIYCAVPGHREAGMVGTLTVEP